MDIEGIKYILETEYRNPAALRDFGKDLDAVKKKVEETRSAIATLGRNQGRARADRSRSRAVKEERKETEALRAEIRGLIAAYKERDLLANRTLEAAQQLTKTTGEDLRRKKAGLDQEKAAATLANEDNKNSLKARQAQNRLQKLQNDAEKTALKTAKDRLSAESSANVARRTQEATRAFKAQNAELLKSTRGRRELVSIEKDLFGIQEARERRRNTADPSARLRLENEVRRRGEAIQRRITALREREAALSRQIAVDVGKQNRGFDSVARRVRQVVASLLVYRAATSVIDLSTRGLVGNAIAFGNELEVGEQSIAGLVLGAGQIRDRYGELVKDGDRFAASQSIARDQIAAIRRDALGTSSTFRELLGNFQLNVRQGLTAGLQLDEFRKISRLFGQGATIFGVPQNQLAEEIRSTLQGTIRSRDTRIATALGITNEDIRNAREQGVLAEFLFEQFQGIAQATEALRNSLPIVTSDLRDAFDIASAEGGKGFREELSRIGAELRDTLTTGAAGQVAVRPELIGNVQKLFIPLEQSLIAIEPLLGTLANTASVFVGALFTGAQAAATALNLVQPLLFVINQTAIGTIAGLQQTLASITAAAGIIRSSLPESEALVKGLANAFRALGVVVSGALVAGGLQLLAGVVGGVLSPAFKKLRKGVKALGLALVVLTKSSVIRALVPLILLGAGVNFLDKQIGKLTGRSAEVETLAQQLGGLFSNIAGSEEVSQVAGVISKLFDDVGESLGAATFGEGGFVITPKEVKITQQVEEALRERLSNIAVESRFDPLASATGTAATAFEKFVSQAKELDATLGAAEDRLKALPQIINETRAKSLDEAILFRKNQQGVATDDEIRQLEKLSTERQASVKVLEDEARALSVDVANARDVANRALIQEVQLLARRNQLASEFAAREAIVDANEQQALSGIDPRGFDSGRLEERVRLESELARRRIEQLRVGRQIADTEAAIAEFRKNAQANGPSGGNDDFATTSAAEVRELKEQLRGSVSSADELRAALKRLDEANSAGTGFNSAVRGQREDLTDAAITERGSSALFNSLRTNSSNALREGIRSAFTGQDVDIGQFGAQFGIDAATSFAQAALEKLLFQGLFGALDTSATVANTAAILANTAAIGGLTVATSVDAATPLTAKGGLIATAPRLPSFASGGMARGKRMSKAPRGADRRDRFLGMFRRNEYVVTPEMDRRSPGLYQSLERIRQATHGAAAMPDITRLSSDVTPSFASGGPAGPDVNVGSSSTQRGASASAVQQVVPTIITSRANMRRIHSSPELTTSLARAKNQSVLSLPRSRRRRIN